MKNKKIQYFAKRNAPPKRCLVRLLLIVLRSDWGSLVLGILCECKALFSAILSSSQFSLIH